MKGIFTLFTLLFSITVYAFPEAPFNALEYDLPFKAQNMNGYNFEGIVKLSNCSGSLVRFTGQPDSSQAYVLTNGHCLGGGFLKPNEYVYQQPSRRIMRVANKDGRFFRVQASQLVYGTMTSTDAALYRLEKTYAELRVMGIEALYMSPDHPVMATPIEVVSGYWEKGYSCRIDAFIYELHEAGWVFNDSIRYTQPGCEVIGGTSGSPVIDRERRIVVGVNNTGNMNGRRCTMNNPCEVNEDGDVTVVRGGSYGQQTYQFYSCLTPDFQLNLEQVGCELFH